MINPQWEEVPSVDTKKKWEEIPMSSLPSQWEEVPTETPINPSQETLTPYLPTTAADIVAPQIKAETQAIPALAQGAVQGAVALPQMATQFVKNISVEGYRAIKNLFSEKSPEELNKIRETTINPFTGQQTQYPTTEALVADQFAKGTLTKDDVEKYHKYVEKEADSFKAWYDKPAVNAFMTGISAIVPGSVGTRALVFGIGSFAKYAGLRKDGFTPQEAGTQVGADIGTYAAFEGIHQIATLGWKKATIKNQNVWEADPSAVQKAVDEAVIPEGGTNPILDRWPNAEKEGIKVTDTEYRGWIKKIRELVGQEPKVTQFVNEEGAPVKNVLETPGRTVEVGGSIPEAVPPKERPAGQSDVTALVPETAPVQEIGGQLPTIPKPIIPEPGAPVIPSTTSPVVGQTSPLPELKGTIPATPGETSAPSIVGGVKETPQELTDRAIREEKYPNQLAADVGERFKKELPKEETTQNRINKTEILQSISKDFNVPIRAKGTSRWRKTIGGTYGPHEGVVRLRMWGDLDVLSHEVAHHIEQLLNKQTSSKWLKQNVPNIKELSALDYNEKQQRLHEGFAEFMRHYLTDGEALLKEKTPQFYQYFTTKFPQEQPRLWSMIQKAKGQYQTWRDQGALQRVVAQIDWKGEHTKAEKPLRKRAQKAKAFLIKAFYEEFYAIEKVTSEVEKISGKKLKPTENPFVMATYYKGKAGALARTFVMKKAIDRYGNIVGKGLEEILAPIDEKEMRTFIAYAVSRRALHLEQERGLESGFDVEDVKYILDKYKNPVWDHVTEEMTEWSNHLLDWVIESGGLTREQANLMRKMNPIFLPFKRAFLDELIVEKTGGASGKKMANIGGIKRFKGSGRATINPIESMIAQATELINKSQKIHIASLLADLADTPGVGGFMSEEHAPVQAQRITKDQLVDMMSKAGVSKEDIKKDEMDDFFTVFTQANSYKGKENIVSIWKDGKQKFYWVHPELYQSLLGMDAIKRGPVLQVLGSFSRLLRLGATGLKLSFGVRNPMRDALTYVTLSKQKFPLITDPLVGLYKELRSQEGDLVWRFKATGGQMSGMMGFDRAATTAVYDELLYRKLSKQGKVLHTVKHPIKALGQVLNVTRDAIGATEMGPRISELEGRIKELKKQHPDWSDADVYVSAFNDAQDVTLNFTKGGYYGKHINEFTAFFNASLQGPNKFYRSMKSNPVRTIVRGLGWLTIPALYFWWQNKDEDWYKNLPFSYKYANLFIPAGNEITRLPIPFDIGSVFMAAPVAAADKAYLKDPKNMEGLYEVFKSAFGANPTPSFAGPIIDVLRNKNFLGIPIETRAMQKLPSSMRENDRTMEISKALSKGFNALGQQLSPVQIDYLINSYSGGFVRQFSVGKNLRNSDLPVISDLLLRTPKNPRRQMDEIFSDFEMLEQKNNAKVITREEKAKFAKIGPAREQTLLFLKLIKKAEEKKDVEKVDQIYEKIRLRLGKAGYE